MQNNIRNYYNTNITHLSSALKKLKQTIFYIYILRLLTFIAFIVFLVFYIIVFKYQLPYLALALLSFLAFLLTVKSDISYSQKARYISNKLELNQNEVNFLDHQYTTANGGEAYAQINPQLAADFDLFGKGSLFQYLNRCATKGGEAKFAEGLCKPTTDASLITARQQAIKELSGKMEFIQDFQCHGMIMQESGRELADLELWLTQPADKNSLLKILCIILPVLNIGWIILMMAGIFTSTSYLLPLTLSFFTLMTRLRRINKAHAMLGKTAKTFENYTAIIGLITKEEFTADYLCSLQQEFSGESQNAGRSLTTLFKLLHNFDFRLNIMIGGLLNALLLFDLQIYLRLQQWKLDNKDGVAAWFKALAEMDALLPYAVFAANNSEFTSYPALSSEEFKFKATALGHPLIPPAVRICNDVDFAGRPAVIIITGANMAGKSTFLRALAVNLIMAMNGSAICAADACFSPAGILPSIKIQDSLLNNESYFYAELLRLKDIISQLKLQPATMVVLDEILRGTNSRDKQLGTLGLLEKLISLNAFVIIATHDLSIADLKNKYPAIVNNHCFEVALQNDQLYFDYKLKDGISQQLNASFLMKKLEIIN